MRISRILEPGLSPEVAGGLDGIDAGRLPPRLLVAGAMDRPVMRAAERDGEFVAHFAAERPWLQVAKMMRIGLLAAADEANLLGNIAKGLAVTIVSRCGNEERALVDAVGLTELPVFFREGLMHANNINTSHLRLPRLRTVRPNSGRSFTLSIQLEFVFVRDL
jgi:hypothetical protein